MCQNLLLCDVLRACCLLGRPTNGVRHWMGCSPTLWFENAELSVWGTQWQNMLYIHRIIYLLLSMLSFLLLQ